MQEVLRILNANATRHKSKENFMVKLKAAEFTIPCDINYYAKSL